MPTIPRPDELLGRFRTDVDRSLRRVRNGALLVSGQSRPPLAQTPKDVVWQAEKVQLWRYRSDDRSIGTPLLLVHSLVSRSYVFDLAPGNSFVELLLDRGFDVYLIDWGVPDALESGNTLETYADGYLPTIVDAVRRTAGSEDVHVLGYCFGGVLSLLYLAGHADAPVRTLTALATPVDLERMGLFSSMLQEGRIEPEDLLDETGNVPERTLMRSFRVLKPTGDMTAYVSLYQHLWNDQFVSTHQMMTTWSRDHIPFPGAAFVQMGRLMTRENLLATGCFPLGGRSVDLRDIRVPFLNVLGEKDHIVPPEANGGLIHMVGSADKEEIRLPSGHVGLFVGSSARQRNIPRIMDWIHTRSAA